MQSFDQALMDLYHRELITYEEALHQATNPDDFALKVRGIQSTEDLTWESFGTAKDGTTAAPGRRGGAPGQAPPPPAGGAGGGLRIDRASERKR